MKSCTVCDNKTRKIRFSSTNWLFLCWAKTFGYDLIYQYESREFAYMKFDSVSLKAASNEAKIHDSLKAASKEAEIHL